MTNSELHQIIKKYRTTKRELQLVDTTLGDIQDPSMEINSIFKKLKYDYKNRRNQLIENQELLKKATKALKSNLIRVLQIIYDSIAPEKTKFPVTRTQGHTVENYIYGVIIDAIQTTTDWGGGMHPVPEFYYNPKSNFNSQPLAEYLADKIDELKRLETRDFFEIEKFSDQMVNDLHNLWEKENKGELTENFEIN